jgi:hypothetical protein
MCPERVLIIIESETNIWENRSGNRIESMKDFLSNKKFVFNDWNRDNVFYFGKFCINNLITKLGKITIQVKIKRTW